MKRLTVSKFEDAQTVIYWLSLIVIAVWVLKIHVIVYNNYIIIVNHVFLLKESIWNKQYIWLPEWWKIMISTLICCRNYTFSTRLCDYCNLGDKRKFRTLFILSKIAVKEQTSRESKVSEYKHWYVGELQSIAANMKKQMALMEELCEVI